MKHNAKNKLLAALLLVAMFFTAFPAAVPFTALPASLLAAESPEPGGEGETAQTAPANEEPDAPTASTPALVQPNPKYPNIVPIVLDVESISSYDTNAMALTAGGEVYTWGYNVGTIGNGLLDRKYYPLTPVNLPGRAVQVAASFELNAVLLEDGSVYDWGPASAGKTRPGAQRYTPAQVPGIPAAASIAVHENAYALTSTGDLWSWGGNSQTVGRGTIDTQTPGKVNLSRVEAVFPEMWGGFARTADGKIHAWGSSNVGVELKAITGINLLRGPGVTNLRGFQAINGRQSFFFVTDTGGLQVYGKNSKGSLGVGHTDKVTKLTTVIESGVVKAEGNLYACFVLKTDGTIWYSGTNYNCFLGVGQQDFSHMVTEFTRFEGLENVVDMEVSANAVYAKTADGCWWAWGYTGYNAGQSPAMVYTYQFIDSPVLIFAPTGYTPVDPEPDTHTITLTETWADSAQPDVVNTYEVEDGRPFSALFTTPAGYTAEVICAENLSINYEAMRVYLYSVTNSFDIVVTYTPETLSGYTPET